MKLYRGLLLDFYGTLVHEDDEIIPVICEQIRRSASIEAVTDDIGKFWWETFSTLFQRSYGTSFLSQRDAAVLSLTETINHFGAALDPVRLIAPQFAHWAAPAVFSDTRPFLDYVASTGRPTCIVSNIDRIDLEQAINVHGLHFDYIVTSDDVQSYKPRPEIFETALNMLGLSADKVLHIGDSRTSDVMGAKRMGIPVAWVNRTGKQVSDSLDPDYIVRDLGELRVSLERTLLPR